jgi:hypothetical protein
MKSIAVNQIVKAWCALAIITIVLGILTQSCASRTIYVPSGEPVRLAAPIKSAPVWVRDASGNWVKGKTTIPEGWYALPDPGKSSK